MAAELQFWQRIDLAMDQNHDIGLAEIDRQHNELSDLIDSLQHAVQDKHQRHLVHSMLKQLIQSLSNHFEYEEEMMATMNYPELEQHKRTHKALLKLIGDHIDHPPEPANYEYYVKLIGDKVLSHVMVHDVAMIDAIKKLLPSPTQVS